uniref:Uncharacterized protein n=1 Tax=Solanum tuberosum TaxID=4113 RepID=M1DUJ5_SOLTU
MDYIKPIHSRTSMLLWSVHKDGGCLACMDAKEGESEECAPFSELENTLARVPNIANCPRSYKGENCSLGKLKTIGHCQVNWAMVPRPPKVLVASQPRQGAEFLAELIGRIAEPLGDPDAELIGRIAEPLGEPNLARPFRVTFGPSM